MKLPPDWSEFIGLLIAHDVRFLIVGAHAMAALGRSRATQDIAFLVEPSEQNAQRLGNALRAFGFGALADESEKFAAPARMAILGNPPLRIDVMNAIDGVSFEEAWAGRVVAEADPGCPSGSRPRLPFSVVNQRRQAHAPR